ncbi:glutamine amidotransferase, partial [Actinomadura sp. DSM 109109]|nr:glutamine amidotransferase [Actinomadura lepetitiana]
LADLLLRWAVGADLQPLDDSWAGRLREERLQAVAAAG